MTRPGARAGGDRPPPAAVHVDLDGAASIYAIHGWDYREADDPLYETGLRNALELFAREGVQATLFVIARDLEHPRRRELLLEALRRGHRVASHSLDHPRWDGLPREEKRRQVVLSRERIGAVLGVEARGFRTPNFEVDRETLELVAEAGYEYDSSCFPTARFARRLGRSEVPLRPFAPLAAGGLLELPLPAYAPLPLPFHASYALVLGEWYFRLGLGRFRRTGAPAILVYHLTDLADPLPAGRLPGLRGRFYTLSHLSAARKREVCGRLLGRLRRDYELGSTEDLVARARSEHDA